MAIIKQCETFLKRFGSIRPTSGGKGYVKMIRLIYIARKQKKDLVFQCARKEIFCAKLGFKMCALW